jgi:VWFA-related protein
MVDLNVVAVDNHGAPVHDLTRDELRVTDSGRPETIAFFRPRDSKRGPVRPPGPNEFSNRSANNIPRATLILFDLLNESFGTRGTAANQLIRDLEALETPEYVYLYLLTLDGRLFPVHGLPPQGAVSPPEGAPWTRQIKPLLEGALRDVQQTRPVDIDVAVRVQITYSALSAIAAELSRVPGHKNIVWITDGVPIELGPNRSDTGDFVDFTPLLRQMSDEFDRSGVAIYPVRQIMLGTPTHIDDGAGPSPGSGPGPANTFTGLGSVDTLDQFAELTGGRPDEGKDIDAAVRQAINDARSSYQIGYYPPETNWDDKYHKLRVTCSRKGVRIEAKTGYYAWREGPGGKAEEAIESTIPTTFDAAEIGLRATLSSDPKGGGTERLEARVDAQDVLLVHEGNLYNGQLRLVVVGYDAGGRPLRGPVIPLDLHYSDEERERALQQGILFGQNVTLAEELKKIRMIVFDRGSNAIGSVTIPVGETAPGEGN